MVSEAVNEREIVYLMHDKSGFIMKQRAHSMTHIYFLASTSKSKENRLILLCTNTQKNTNSPYRIYECKQQKKRRRNQLKIK